MLVFLDAAMKGKIGHAEGAHPAKNSDLRVPGKVSLTIAALACRHAA
jgi:hypothetical protein